MNIKFLDLNRQYQMLKQELNLAAVNVLESGQFILGPQVSNFEKDFAQFVSAPYAVGCASGTDALELALAALDLTAEDEVITTPMTYVATTEAIHHIGAKIVFVDIDEKTYNINPALIEEKINKHTKVILPIHLFGQSACMIQLNALAQKHNLKIVGDAAQAVGSCWENRDVSTMATLSTYSFYPSKNLGGCGDGGMIVTQDEKLYHKLRQLRHHGRTISPYEYEIRGRNSRLDSLQAALLHVKLSHLKKWNEERREKAFTYNKLLAGLTEVITPCEDSRGYHVYHAYCIRAQDRDKLKKYLFENGIETNIYYPIPLHVQPIYRNLDHSRGDFPVTEKVCDNILALPIYPELHNEEIKCVVKTIKNFYSH